MENKVLAIDRSPHEKFFWARHKFWRWALPMTTTLLTKSANRSMIAANGNDSGFQAEISDTGPQTVLIVFESLTLRNIRQRGGSHFQFSSDAIARWKPLEFALPRMSDFARISDEETGIFADRGTKSIGKLIWCIDLFVSIRIAVFSWLSSL
jgi:hypothetical protein